jgi:hypothetical protein
MSSEIRAGVRSRQITESDFTGVVDLLTEGFPVRSPRYWQSALAALASHGTPPGLPKYGYLLEQDGSPVGVILLIYSAIAAGGTTTLRCNVSSWYVQPEFRSHASLLISQATKRKDITYINVSPALHTLPIIGAQGFMPYSSGRFLALPAISEGGRDDTAKIAGIDAPPQVRFEPSELELLKVHQRFGCLSLWCTTADEALPFVFMPQTVKGIIPCMQLVHCRDIGDFVRFARPLGRYLAKRGRPVVIIDSNGPIPGLVGRYFDGKSPKYYKGPRRPNFGDLAYTETVMFGRRHSRFFA